VIIRCSITRFCSNTILAGAVFLIASHPAEAAIPPAKPLIISIVPIVPKSDGEHLSGLDNGVDDLKAALYNAWQRRTDRELDIKIPDEEVSLVVKETSKMTTPPPETIATYIVRTTYRKVGNRTTATAELWRPERYAALSEVQDDHINPDAEKPFTVLGEKLASALAHSEGIAATSYRLAFCRFAFSGGSKALEATPENLRMMTLHYFGIAVPIAILEAEPSDCGQQTVGNGEPASKPAAGGTETIYVSGTVSFLPDTILIRLVVQGEVIAEHECKREQDLQDKETINSLIPDFLSGLTEQIQVRRHRRGG